MHAVDNYEGTPMINRRQLLTATAAALLTPWQTGRADDYPSRPIKFINPYTGGSNGDIAPRMVTDVAGPALKQPFVVESRTGASGMLAMRLLAGSPNDGYTVGLGTSATMLTAPLTSLNPGFDADTDFDPITLICDVPFVLSVTNDLPVKSVKDLVDYVRANPDKLSYASDGIGTTTHLATELLLQSAGLKAAHVPYRGGAAAYTQDLVSGRVQFAIGGIGVPLGLHRDGRIRIIGVTSSKRVSVLPDMPTIAEQGFPDYQASSWFGIFAPRGIPKIALTRLHTELRRAADSKEVSEKLLGRGFQPVTTTPDELKSIIKTDRVRWTRVAELAKVPKQ